MLEVELGKHGIQPHSSAISQISIDTNPIQHLVDLVNAHPSLHPPDGERVLVPGRIPRLDALLHKQWRSPAQHPSMAIQFRISPRVSYAGQAFDCTRAGQIVSTVLSNHQDDLVDPLLVDPLLVDTPIVGPATSARSCDDGHAFVRSPGRDVAADHTPWLEATNRGGQRRAEAVDETGTIGICMAPRV